MKIVLKILYVLLLLQSCSNLNNNYYDSIQDQNKILNLVFNDLIPSDTVYRNEAKKVSKIEYSKIIENDTSLIGYFNSQSEYRLLSHFRDTSTIYLIMHDSFETARYFYLDYFGHITQENFKSIFGEKNLSYRDILIGWTNLKESKELELERLKSSSKYKFVFQSVSREKSSSGRFNAHVFYISRVAFDKTGSKACAYAEQQCGAICGSGYMYFLLKEETGWKIIHKTLLKQEW